MPQFVLCSCCMQWHIMTLCHSNVLQDVDRECLNQLNACLINLLDIKSVLLISFMTVVTMLDKFTLKIVWFVRTRQYSVVSVCDRKQLSGIAVFYFTHLLVVFSFLIFLMKKNYLWNCSTSLLARLLIHFHTDTVRLSVRNDNPWSPCTTILL